MSNSCNIKLSNKVKKDLGSLNIRNWKAWVKNMDNSWNWPGPVKGYGATDDDKYMHNVYIT